MEAENSLLENLPITETTFFILLSLAGEARHGYGIMKDVEAISDARVRFSTGTLYGALQRLLRKGWIERLTVHQSPRSSDDRNQKHYAITQEGRDVLKAETERMRKLVFIAQVQRLGT